MSAKNTVLGMQHLTVVPANFEPETTETPQPADELQTAEGDEADR